MKLKRYALFSGVHYYPEGGMRDFDGFFDSIEDVKAKVRDHWDWLQIVDTQTWQTITDLGTEPAIREWLAR